jgi:hypothetical protein
MAKVAKRIQIQRADKNYVQEKQKEPTGNKKENQREI